MRLPWKRRGAAASPPNELVDLRLSFLHERELTAFRKQINEMVRLETDEVTLGWDNATFRVNGAFARRIAEESTFLGAPSRAVTDEQVGGE